MATEQMIDPAAQSVWQKATSFARAVGSVATKGLVDEATYKKRLDSCHACELLDRSPDGQEYCGGCGCGRWPLSRLDRKLYVPELVCPLGRSGFANEGVPVVKSSWKSCVGCSRPEADLTPIPVGSRVLIVARMPNEAPDTSPWRVVAARGTDGKDGGAYDLVRSRRLFSWAWWKALGRRERATVSRTAIQAA